MSSPVSNSAPPSPSSETYSLHTARYSLLLLSYFRSGWAFLVPYLVAYLLYAWLDWPVNPTSSDRPASTSLSASSSTGLAQPDSSAFFRAPSLLHLYWALHAGHLVLGVLAFRHWWRDSAERRPWSAVLYSAGPWLCLALLFYLPGLYLEFPADTWAHLGRITQWQYCQLVRDHPVWTKSSYLLYASLLPSASAGFELRTLAFDLLGTATGLLLCWQQFRLARALGFGPRPAFVYVLLQTLILGSSSFSFYRYYSLSSTIMGQIAAIALLVGVIQRFHPLPLAPPPLRPPGWPAFGLAVLGLGFLCAFNHPQSVAIAAVSVTGALVAKLIMRAPRALWLVVALAVGGSVLAVQYFPRHEMLDQLYVPAGWLTRVYSFNLLSLDSPAALRSVEILGVAGLLGLLLSLAYLRRNPLIGLLGLFPVVALLTPLSSLPFASALATGLETPVRMFHRLYFAIPAGIALLLAGCWLCKYSPAARGAWGHVLLFSALLFIVASPGNHPWFNRSFHLMMRPPFDVSYGSLRKATAQIPSGHLLVATPGREYVTSAWQGTRTLQPLRLLAGQAATQVWTHRHNLSPTPDQPLFLLQPLPYELHTPASIMGRMSGHWPSADAALDNLTVDGP